MFSQMPTLERYPQNGNKVSGRVQDFGMALASREGGCKKDRGAGKLAGDKLVKVLHLLGKRDGETSATRCLNRHALARPCILDIIAKRRRLFFYRRSALNSASVHLIACGAAGHAQYTMETVPCGDVPEIESGIAGKWPLGALMQLRRNKRRSHVSCSCKWHSAPSSRHPRPWRAPCSMGAALGPLQSDPRRHTRCTAIRCRHRAFFAHMPRDQPC